MLLTHVNTYYARIDSCFQLAQIHMVENLYVRMPHRHEKPIRMLLSVIKKEKSTRNTESISSSEPPLHEKHVQVLFGWAYYATSEKRDESAALILYSWWLWSSRSLLQMLTYTTGSNPSAYAANLYYAHVY